MLSLSDYDVPYNSKITFISDILQYKCVRFHLNFLLKFSLDMKVSGAGSY